MLLNACAPVCQANANHIKRWRRGQALDAAVSHFECEEPGSLAEIPQLQGALLACHHNLVQVGVWMSHAGRCEVIP